MKHYLCLLFFMVIGFTILSGCQSDNSKQSIKTTDWKPTIYETVNNVDGVTMIAKEGAVSSSGMTVIFENSSNKQCTYGEYFLLEKKFEGKWYQVPVVLDGNYGFNDIGYGLASSGVSEWNVALFGYKDILDFRKAGDFDEYYLTAE